jgi:hypothetical protein
MSRKSSNNSEASYGDSHAPKSNDQCSVNVVPNTTYQSLIKSGNGNLPSKVTSSPSYQFQMKRKLVIYFRFYLIYYDNFNFFLVMCFQLKCPLCFGLFICFDFFQSPTSNHIWCNKFFCVYCLYLLCFLENVYTYLYT